MKLYFRQKIYFLFSFILVIGLGTTSCKKDCENAASVSCADTESEERTWLDKMGGRDINFMDTTKVTLYTQPKLLTIKFDPLTNNTTNDRNNYNDECEETCEVVSEIKGTLWHQGQHSISISITKSTSNNSSGIEKTVLIKIGEYSLSAVLSPFYKHYRSRLYKEIKLGDKTYQDVYKIPISFDSVVDTSVTFQIDELFITEAAGIVGLKNKIDGTEFYLVD